MNLVKPITNDNRIDATIIFGIFILTAVSFVILQFASPRNWLEVVLPFVVYFGQIANVVLAFLLVTSYMCRRSADERHGVWVLAALAVAVVPLILGLVFTE